MKKIEAIIKPFKLEEVKEALTGIGVEGMTVTDVKGFGRQKGQTEVYRGSEYTVNLLPKVKIEVVATESCRRSSRAANMSPRRRARSGTGESICHRTIDRSVRIRTDEEGEASV